MEMIESRDQKLITSWLFMGVVMVFFQILLGGITRLTGSGLSITHWDLITGIFPPFNYEQWTRSFDLYKETPQYQHINSGMTLGEFKYIFLWEYTHRLWARLMGFIFIIPFLFFLSRKSLSKNILRRLFVVIMIAGLAAVFGWVMVTSGLIDRPWVNAYNLTVHLGLGILLFVTLSMSWLYQKGFKKMTVNRSWRFALLILLLLTCLQIMFGGFVSGMKSALNYPSWPKMNHEWVPELILERSQWNVNNFLLYDITGFMPAVALFVHRNLAYIIGVYIIIFAIQWWKKKGENWRWISIVLLGTIVVQISMGILTLLYSIGSIPVYFGSIHQGVGILFITFLIYLRQVIKKQYIT